jgi:two-component system LytT family response regulator
MQTAAWYQKLLCLIALLAALTMAEITTLIVDDEPAARRGLLTLLSKEPGFSVIGEARHGREALQKILQLRPSLVFLDIQMPEMNGFDVIEALGETFMPAIVFVTAYDEWAVRAFEVQALDYILKPFEDERLHGVLRRVKAHFAAAQPGDFMHKMQTLLAERMQGPRFLTRLLVRESGTVHFIPLEEVDWIEAADYYTRVHFGKRTELVRYSMNDLEKQLDPQQFVRVHRSAIVNVARVKEIRVAHQNHHAILLTTGASIPLSRSKKELLEDVLVRAR